MIVAFRVFCGFLVLSLLMLAGYLSPPGPTCFPTPPPSRFIPYVDPTFVWLYVLGGFVVVSAVGLGLFIVGNTFWSRMTSR